MEYTNNLRAKSIDEVREMSDIPILTMLVICLLLVIFVVSPIKDIKKNN